MWNTSIALEDGEEETRDDEDYVTKVKKFINGVPASKKDCTRADIELGMKMQYKANINFEIMKCNYNGCGKIIDEGTGKIYKIERTYTPDKGNTINLTCSEVGGECGV